MSKQITLADITKEITEDDVRLMIQMESNQTPEWSTLFSGMSYELKSKYYDLKEQILKVNEQLQHVEKDKELIRKDYLAFYHQGVSRGSFSYTIEHILEEVNSGLDIEKIKQQYGYEAFKTIQNLRKVRNDKEEFTFFWETKSPFSQWYKSTFEGPSVLFMNIEEQEKFLGHTKTSLNFSSTEQFMMYHKAILFLDNEIATRILEETNARKIKEFGRQVRDFDVDVWSYFRSKVVYEGNKAKFAQNSKFMDALTDTLGTTLAEAAPNDNIWGIGLAKDNPKAQKRETWEGKNLLGEILTLLRIEFMGMY